MIMFAAACLASGVALAAFGVVDWRRRGEDAGSEVLFWRVVIGLMIAGAALSRLIAG